MAGVNDWMPTSVTTIVEPSTPALSEFAEALDHFGRSTLLIKKALIQSCACCVAADGKVRPGEYELLRAICSSLDCPLPPLPVLEPIAPLDA